MLLLHLHTDVSGGKYSGMIFPSPEEFFHYLVIHTVKGYEIVNKAEVDVAVVQDSEKVCLKLNIQ